MNKVQQNLLPDLRFSEFKGEWINDRVDSFVERVSNPVDVDVNVSYKQIGIRSHGKGIFHKPSVLGKELGAKRVFWVHTQAFVVNIVFGWEQAVALSSQSEEGYIASHRFPMFIPLNNKIDLRFLLFFFLRPKGKYVLELASPGGAGRNKTLGQNEFAKSKIIVPDIKEQQKIANFLTAVDQRISLLKQKKVDLETYKKGLMQKIFSQEIRFKDENGDDYSDWEEKRAKNVFYSHSNKDHDGTLPILSASQKHGMIYREGSGIKIQASVKSVRSYKIVEPGDFVISLRSFQGGLDYSNLKGICSPAYTILKNSIPIDENFYKFYFKKERFIEQLSKTTVGIRDGKQITYSAFGALKISYPSVDEQSRISNCLSTIDKSSNKIKKQIEQTTQFKKGLLQRMFV